MSNVAIKAEGLSKQYRIGLPRGYQTIRETLMQAASSPWRRLRSRRSGGQENSGPDRIWALRDVDLEVKHGEVVGIIGRNGAGKSTLLKILSGITDPTLGYADIFGRVGSLLEVGTGFHMELTGRENIFMNGAILGMHRHEIRRKFDEIVAFSEVEEFLDTPVKRYSSGMYLRLAFSVAAHLESEVLLVDEVLAVGDAKFQEKCLGKMRSVTAEGRTILFVSHNMAAIRNLCKRTFLLDQGRVVSDADTDRAIARHLDRNLAEGSVVSGPQLEEKVEGVIDRVNPTIRLRELALTDEEGSPCNDFRSDQSIVISVTYECFSSVSGLWLVVQLVDEDGKPILTTQNVDSPDGTNFYRRVRGMYKSFCVVPPDTFGSRRLYVSVQLIHPAVEHLFVNKVLGFDSTFQGYENVYDGYNDAPMRPRLSWKTTCLSEAGEVPRG